MRTRRLTNPPPSAPPTVDWRNKRRLLYALLWQEHTEPRVYAAHDVAGEPARITTPPPRGRVITFGGHS